MLERDTGLEEVAETGVMLHADISVDLLRTIFAPRTALHDGAVIIRDETILAAGALLPLAEMTVHTERFGTRHRAALGITEQTDAVVVVVSEENSQVSLVERARIVRNLSEPQLARAIRALLAPTDGRGRLGRRVLPDVATGGRAPRLSDLGRFVGRRAAAARAPRRPGPTTTRRPHEPPMRRLLGLITYNWPLKLMAIVLATLLYAGLVVSQSTFTFDTPIPIRVVNQPTDAVLLVNLPTVNRIRYIASGDAGVAADPDSFLASVDLTRRRSRMPAPRS